MEAKSLTNVELFERLRELLKCLLEKKSVPMIFYKGRPWWFDRNSENDWRIAFTLLAEILDDMDIKIERSLELLEGFLRILPSSVSSKTLNMIRRDICFRFPHRRDRFQGLISEKINDRRIKTQRGIKKPPPPP